MVLCSVERHAIEAPIKCFGLEQHPGNKSCPTCPHQRECEDLMGNLVDRIEVDKARFQLIPPGLVKRLNIPDVYEWDPDLLNIEKVYEFCHKWVFGTKPSGSVGKHRKLILQRVRQAKTSIKMFFLTNMFGWKESRDHQRFSAKVLTLDYAVDQVNTFASVCHKKYGAFDTSGLDLLMKSDVATQDFESHLLNSEIMAGNWIVGYKLFHQGRIVENIYREIEIELNPYWLATEETYFNEILQPHLDNPGACDDPVIKKHRWNALQVRGRMLREPRRALLVFTRRQVIVKVAIQKVLATRGLRAEHFLMEDIPVVNMFKFWARLGQAVQHYECLKYVEGLPSAFDAKIRSAITL